MNTRIVSALTALFEKHRIIFWYDAQHELREEYEALDDAALPGVRKLEIANNEFGLKYRVLREERQQKFLLYQDGPQPEDSENWLLDVVLANGVFRTDQAGLWLAEFDLGIEMSAVVEEHLEFFRSAKRRDQLKKLITNTDSALQIQLAMLAVCAGADKRLDAICEALLQEVAQDTDEKCRLVQRCGLEKFFWKQLERVFGYHSNSPTLQDFVLTLFKASYAMGLRGENELLSGDAVVFVKRWKDNRTAQEAFKILSDRCASQLNIEEDLAKRDYRDVLSMDIFRVIDQKIISDLVQSILLRTIGHEDLEEQLRQRRQSPWYDEYMHLYEALACASRFLFLKDQVQLHMETPARAIQLYASSWYQIDQAYRHFMYHAQHSAHLSIMDSLEEQIENVYSNDFVLGLGNRFQELLDDLSDWSIPTLDRQDSFFERFVRPFVNRDKKVCVIISDALRYEIGAELQQKIRREDRYEAELGFMYTLLPSYTQLGMAALLPHKSLSFDTANAGLVLADGMPTSGSENRNRILANTLNGRGSVYKAKQVLDEFSASEMRDIVRNNDVLYIYHNQIDATGDKPETETRVFASANQALEELVTLIKKLVNSNITNLVITSDHGFLFQTRAVDESDFIETQGLSDAYACKSRRFILGQHLTSHDRLRTFSSAQMGMAGDMDIQIPFSINRLKVRGSGSRYVHGGASLQEIVVPVVRVNKKRQSDTSQVDVEILSGGTSVITSGQLAVTFYQVEAVTAKKHGRALQAGIYTEDDVLISDSHDLTFDKESPDPRDREQTVRFLLTSGAEACNGKDVLLKLKENIPGTRYYRDYASCRYTIRRSFTLDFDF